MSNTETLYIGDNAEVLRSLNTHSVDLVYLDPPFNKNKNFQAPIGGRSKVAAFKDTWDESDIKSDELQLLLNSHPSLGALIELVGETLDDSWKWYLVFMAVRLIEIHRILKPTGSVYLHCDQTMSHSLKLLMDFVFGKSNFCNEIVWRKTNSPKAQSRVFGAQHDIILYYAKGGGFTFNKVHLEADEAYLKSFRYEDERGKYQTIALVAGGLQRTPDRKTFEFGGVVAPWLYKKETLEQWQKDGLIVKTKTGGYRKKDYLCEREGKLVADIWVDNAVAPMQGKAKERADYPTQKPLALLHRIIKASSNKGDIVLDPFCGCATACVAAAELDRKWIGIDISEAAEERMRERMTDEQMSKKGAVLENVKESWAKAKIWHVDEIPEHKDPESKILGPGLPKRKLDPGFDAPFHKTDANKAKLYHEQDGKCRFYEFCGHEVGTNRDVDRIIPGKRGGQYVWDNVQLLCRDCNATRGPRTMQETERNLREELLHRNLADLTARQKKRDEEIRERRKMFPRPKGKKGLA